MIKLNMLYTQEIKKNQLNHGLVLKKAHRVIQFNEKAWLKPYKTKSKK